MPREEIFFEAEAGNQTVKVIKSYDEQLVHDAFDNMLESAKLHLWESLDLNSSFHPEDVPLPNTADWDDLLWEELFDSSREDGNVFSFFIVESTEAKRSQMLYASPDWTSAEAFAKQLVG